MWFLPSCGGKHKVNRIAMLTEGKASYIITSEVTVDLLIRAVEL